VALQSQRRARLCQDSRAVADRVVIGDGLTSQLAFTAKFSAEQLYSFAATAAVVRELKPLIEAGVITFRQVSSAFHRHCYEAFVRESDTIADQIVNEVCDSITGTVDNGTLYVDMSTITSPGEPNLLMRKLGTAANAMKRQNASPTEMARIAFREHMRQAMRDTFISMKASSRLGGVFVSGSRPTLRAVRHFDTLGGGRHAASNQIDVWEAARSAELPWLRDLSVAQVLRVRNEAQSALPRLRERLSGALKTMPSDEESVQKLVQELRVEAEDLRAEFNVFIRNRDAAFRNVSGVLGITISLYGFGAGFVPPAAALGSLMSLLALLHTAQRREIADETQLMSKPAYVLLKAREILDHGHR